MLDFITYYNGGNFDTSGTRTGGASRVAASSGAEGIRMRSLKSGRRKSDLGYAGGTVRERSREGEGEGVVSDGDSQEMIIRKDVSIRVDNDTMRGRHEDLGRPGFM